MKYKGKRFLNLEFSLKILTSITTTILYYIMSLKTASKRFDRCRIQLPDWLHALGSVTPILFDLHWLPVSERIKFKIVLFTFKALHQQSPTYIQDLITRYLPSRSLRSSFTLSLNPVSFITLRPMDLEHSLSQPPSFGTNYLTTYARARI